MLLILLNTTLSEDSNLQQIEGIIGFPELGNHTVLFGGMYQICIIFTKIQLIRKMTLQQT